MIKNTLKTYPLFSECDDNFLESLSRQANVFDAPKNKVIFLSQEDANNFYILQKGWVKLFRETLEGTQAIIDVIPQGHMFGESCLFEDDKYPFSAEVIESATLISLPISALKSEIEQNPKLAISMLSSMARYRKQQDKELEHRTLQNTPQRIGCFLLRLVDQNAKGPVTIHLPYDKTLVAMRLGMQPETFSRGISTLKKATGMQVKGSTIQLDDVSNLAEYSCSACSSEFPCKSLKTTQNF